MGHNSNDVNKTTTMCMSDSNSRSDIDHIAELQINNNSFSKNYMQAKKRKENKNNCQNERSFFDNEDDDSGEFQSLKRDQSCYNQVDLDEKNGKEFNFKKVKRINRKNNFLPGLFFSRVPDQ